MHRIIICLIALCSAEAIAATVTLSPWTEQRITMGLANVQQAVAVPEGCLWIQFRCANDCDLTIATGSDGGARGAHYLTFDADTWNEWRVKGSGHGKSTRNPGTVTYYFSSATASTVLTVMCTTDGD